MDTGTPVDDKDYQVPFNFSGKIEKITIDLGEGPLPTDRCGRSTPKTGPAGRRRWRVLWAKTGHSGQESGVPGPAASPDCDAEKFGQAKPAIISGCRQ